MLLGARYFCAIDMVLNGVFCDQPFPCRSVDKGQIDRIGVFSAELLKCSVRDKRIHQFQLPD